VRDAANLSWKLAAVVSGKADETLLDTYQVEREPHVRTYIAASLEMGRMVCVLDEAQAAARDSFMLGARAAGVAPPPPPQPGPFAAGCILPGTPEAGSYFPQFTVDGGSERLDNTLGSAPWLIERDDPRLGRFAGPLAAWLDKHGVEAVLVRPDRYVFGTGRAQDLRDAYQRSVGQGALATPIGHPYLGG
jgi:3-(3-hydroxy-phenyl)propionate hydroxylase